MPGSDGSHASEGDLVQVARPTLDGQLVDAASAAIEKIRQKAAVAKGSWMKWVSAATGDAESKVDTSLQGVQEETTDSSSTLPRDHIPAGPAWQTSSSSPGYALSSSTFASPHGSSRSSRAPSIKCPSPADVSPPLEPHPWENHDDDHTLLAETPAVAEKPSTISRHESKTDDDEDDDDDADGETSELAPKLLAPGTELNEHVLGVARAGQEMAKNLRATVVRVAEREHAARLTHPPRPASELEPTGKPRPRAPGEGRAESRSSGVSDVAVHPGPLAVLGGESVTLPVRSHDDDGHSVSSLQGSTEGSRASEGSRLSLREWLGGVGTGLGLDVTDSKAREEGSGAEGAGVQCEGPVGPGSTGSGRTPSPHAAPSGAAWASALDMSVHDLVGPVRDRLNRKVEKVMKAVTPHMDAVRDALGIMAPPDASGRCFRSVVTQMGHTYQGEFKDGLMDGYGRLEWPDGHWYQGEFRRGETMGVGRRVWGGGLEFVGEEVNGRKQGVGVMTWPDGRRYEGRFAGDVKDGVGLMVWAGGEWYLGGWRGGVKHGDGLEGGPGVGVLAVQYAAGRCAWGEAAEGLEAEEWEVADWMRALLWPEGQGGGVTPRSAQSGAEDTARARAGGKGRRRGEERKIARHAVQQVATSEDEVLVDPSEPSAQGGPRCVLQVVNGEIWSIPHGMESKAEGNEGAVEEEEGRSQRRRRDDGWSADMPREAGEEEDGQADFVEEGDGPPPVGVGVGGELVVEGSWDEGVEEGLGAPQLEHSLSSDSVLSSSSSSLSSGDGSPLRSGSWTEGGGRVRLRDRMLEMFQGGSLSEMVADDRHAERSCAMGLAERLADKRNRAVSATASKSPPISPSTVDPLLWDRPVPAPPASSPPALPSASLAVSPQPPVTVGPEELSMPDRQLWAASAEGDVEEIRAALKRGGRVGQRDAGDRGNTALHKAAASGRLEAVQELVGQGADVAVRNEYGDTALHCAAFGGHVAAAAALVERGAELDGSSQDGETPLHCAAYGGHAEVCALLAGRGASVNVAAGGDGDTALHLAAIGGHEEAVQALLAAGANPLIANREGQTARDVAELQGWHGVASALLEAATPDCVL